MWYNFETMLINDYAKLQTYYFGINGLNDFRVKDAQIILLSKSAL